MILSVFVFIHPVNAFGLEQVIQFFMGIAKALIPRGIEVVCKNHEIPEIFFRAIVRYCVDCIGDVQKIILYRAVSIFKGK